LVLLPAGILNSLQTSDYGWVWVGLPMHSPGARLGLSYAVCPTTPLVGKLGRVGHVRKSNGGCLCLNNIMSLQTIKVELAKSDFGPKPGFPLPVQCLPFN
jgi:hypothetical protein